MPDSTGVNLTHIHVSYHVPLCLRSGNKYTREYKIFSDRCLRIKIKFIDNAGKDFTKVQNFIYYNATRQQNVRTKYQYQGEVMKQEMSILISSFLSF